MAFKILPFFGRSAEKEIVDLMRKHMQKIFAMNNVLVEAGNAVVAGKYKIVGEKAKEISEMEHEADGVRREMLSKLYGGAFLPGMRMQLYNLINMLDDIAGDIQNSIQAFVYLRNKTFPKEVKSIFSKIIAETSETLLSLGKALEDLLEGKPELASDVKEVLKKEHNIDLLKKELFDYTLFAKKLDPLSSRVIGDIVDFVSHISDMAETCADQMELLKILRQA